MKRKHWVVISITLSVAIILLGLTQSIVQFNNQMIYLSEQKKSAIETTKVEYGQCIIKILELNQTAKNYTKDVNNLSKLAGQNLQKFNQHLLALIGTQVIAKLSPNLRENVQKEIISCRNAYIGRVDYSLKPLYVEFNRLQRQFPNSLYNALFFHWRVDELNMPQTNATRHVFKTHQIKPLELS